jgi:hypothetical protein
MKKKKQQTDANHAFRVIDCSRQSIKINHTKMGIIWVKRSSVDVQYSLQCVPHTLLFII